MKLFFALSIASTVYSKCIWYASAIVTLPSDNHSFRDADFDVYIRDDKFTYTKDKKPCLFDDFKVTAALSYKEERIAAAYNHTKKQEAAPVYTFHRDGQAIKSYPEVEFEYTLEKNYLVFANTKVCFDLTP